ncbi:MAG: hypothetical protein QY322_02935 [bacterium]|nr:MAG: hypothetical protein QY322_02935 [bacterium]
MALLEQIKETSVPLKSLFVTSFIVNCVFILISLVSTVILPPEIPLFFGLPKSTSQLAANYMILVPSLISTFLVTANFIIALKVSGQYIKKILAFTSVSVTILNVIATSKIVFLVGSFAN